MLMNPQNTANTTPPGATPTKVMYFQNVSRTCSVGSKKPSEHFYLAGKVFHSVPGQIHHDAQGTLYALIEQTGFRYPVTVGDPSELSQFLADGKVREEDILEDGRSFRGLQTVFRPIDPSRAIAENAKLGLTVEELASLRVRAAKLEEVEDKCAKLQKVVDDQAGTLAALEEFRKQMEGGDLAVVKAERDRLLLLTSQQSERISVLEKSVAAAGEPPADDKTAPDSKPRGRK